VDPETVPGKMDGVAPLTASQLKNPVLIFPFEQFGGKRGRIAGFGPKHVRITEKGILPVSALGVQYFLHIVSGALIGTER